MAGRQRKTDAPENGEAGDYAKAMDAALKLLGYRPRTGREIERRLREKGISGSVAARVRRRLEEIGYVDDRQFALLWIKSRSGPQCRSAWLVKRELRRKGIDSELADEIVDEEYNEESVLEDACALVKRKLGRLGGSDEAKAMRRLQNMLLRRGFSYDFIKEVLKRVKGEL